MYLLTADEMRQMDQMTIEDFGLPGRVLMENAGRGAARVILETWPEIRTGRVAVIAGRGNNGGDGFVIARCLSQADVTVTVYLLAQKHRVHGEALANLELLSSLNVNVVELPDENGFNQHKEDMDKNRLWVDAILGTGLADDVKGYFKTVIEHINAHPSPVFAVDIPSGLNSETGTPCGVCIQADATATFAFAKIGHTLMPGASHTGRLHIIDIGIPHNIKDKVFPRQYLSMGDDIRGLLKTRSPQAHKGTSGHLMIAAGSPGKTGAAIMTAMSAMRCGAGLVTLGIPKSINDIVESHLCEAMTHPLPDNGDGVLTNTMLDDILSVLEGKRCLAIGPGIGVAEETKALVHNLILKSPIPIVLDADGLNCIAGDTGILKNRNADIVLTPHPGEMARLIDSTSVNVLKDVIGCARSFAQSKGVYVVLKGARTVIAFPDGQVHVNPTGNSGMASGGMGDVLTGVIAGFITQKYDISSSLRIAVYLHGVAADMIFQKRAYYGYLATDVINNLPEAIKSIMDGKVSINGEIFSPIL